MSDQEGEPHAGSSTEGRRQSRSPKTKGPKLGILRPGGSTRRRSIRRGMLGVRVLGRRHDGESDSMPVPPRTSHMQSSSGGDADAESDSEHGRGRRSALSPLTSTSPASSSPVRPRHARIDSLRSVDTRSRRSLREASPARSIRWADYDSGSIHGRSGTSTPGILSPSTPITPLPGSEDEDDDNHVHERARDSPPEPATPHMVRFDVPDSLP